MSTPTPNPTLILTPGAWYPPHAFSPLITHLPTYTCHTVSFPSIQAATEVKDLQPDILTIRTLVEKEADAGNDIVIVCHSWSGLPVNSALSSLSKESRQKEGKVGGVVKIIFISAFIPEVGESLIAAFGGEAPEWYVRDEAAGTVSTSDPYSLFFHDVPDGKAWAETLRPHAWATKISPATGPPMWIFPEDRAIPLFVQELMVEKARAKGARIETEKIKTAHSPWLVVPDQVAEFVKRHATATATTAV
ncbi:hypothetical protein BO94DRAFT_540935 [Aspergillus sclerotioniger CBS 115572]|uniref:AB hydrolase-1 domain-containing protein n=1 Tax=Aspergillus sclerotioniger CBS 115572 TaxID=1450535 RepID=A0A317UW73_9EURO|nr:hypothetical protein BO94DRAFT_540935 [Aspergillus sclerotioniger CBS 115572]PWY64732.1 hypothetical protein BO94DRAFT_540935 [Aspergillus sclerotioniger CBS 115572]